MTETGDTGTAAPRTLVAWVPDWPIVAWGRERGHQIERDEPVAVFAQGAVRACSEAAREEGVRSGQRRRDAQARCPQLQVVEADPVRDHRAFAPLITAIEEAAPGVQVLEPGLCALHAKGPARYYGGEAAAATVVSGAIASLSVADARIGVADGVFAAEQAARCGTRAAEPMRIVPAGRAAEFLAPLSVAALEGDVAGVADLFARLGVQTLGHVADLGVDRLTERFGARGARLHSLATGRDLSPVTARTPPPELHREISFEPPVALADQVAFGVRVPAEQFTAGLGAQNLVCTGLRVIVTGERGGRSARVWLHPGAFDAAAIVDRVRWQLAEQGPGGPTALRSAVATVRLEPEGVDAAAHHTARLFGSGPEERVHHALSRVQAMLGHRGVLTPEIGGGRWLAERQRLVPWGDVLDPAVRRDVTHPWPGSLPGPLPTTVFAHTVPVAVLDGDGDMVAVDARGELTGTPISLTVAGRRWGIQAWAGPWPLVERGWDNARARRAHRFQIVDAAQTAWLLVCEEGSWHAEGVYD